MLGVGITEPKRDQHQTGTQQNRSQGKSAFNGKERFIFQSCTPHLVHF
ncbi:Uncharacterised protein [Vibrio cholerae]|nr:Uncharacterised protein [Vibrio cholerae]